MDKRLNYRNVGLDYNGYNAPSCMTAHFMIIIHYYVTSLFCDKDLQTIWSVCLLPSKPGHPEVQGQEETRFDS
jgi:hypothetical protein